METLRDKNRSKFTHLWQIPTSNVGNYFSFHQHKRACGVEWTFYARSVAESGSVPGEYRGKVVCFSRSALWLLTLAREKLLSQSMGEGRLEHRSPVGDVKLFHAESSIVAGRAVPRQIFPRYDAHNHVTAVNNHEMTQPQGSEQLEDPRQRGSMRDGVGR